MLSLIDRLRIRGVHESFTRNEQLKKLNEAVNTLKRQNQSLLQAEFEKFSKLKLKNKRRLLYYKTEYKNLKMEYKNMKTKLKNERARLRQEYQKNIKKLEFIKKQLRYERIYCY